MSTKIKPAIRGPKNYRDYTDLKIGDKFIWHGFLWVKSDNTGDFSQTAMNLTTGRWEIDMCGEQVLPVDVVITWQKNQGATQ